MKRLWLVWFLFALFLAVGFAAMAWISFTILRLDRAETDARQNAALEENVRLALWRMDSMLSPILAQEIARPYFAYTPFTPAERAYTHMFSEIAFGEVLIPSPLLTFDSTLIDLHFQFLPDGSLTSPQVPTGNMRDLASKHVSRDRIYAASEKLDRLRIIIDRDSLLARLPSQPSQPPIAIPDPLPLQQDEADDQQLRQQRARQPQFQQALKSANEFQARDANTAKVSNYEFAANRATLQDADPANHISEGIMRPLWIGQTLLLARKLSINNQDYVQGCWLNLAAIRSTLLNDIRDLLPNAQLLPIATNSPESNPRRLAALPLKLVPGPPTLPHLDSLSPVRLTLLLAWIGLIVASGALAALLWGAITLSLRRGAFVSAVTHELRTPLTTVSMYAEMLQQGMVTDPDKRLKYLATLRAEADRLGHLVENVLAYSRIERGSPNGRIQTIPLPKLLDDLKDRLATRAEQASLQLIIETDLSPDAAVRADASAVEQILLNLIDNAGKYARNASDRRLHLQIRSDGPFLAIRLKDHGPGIAPPDARRLFKPFSKSARDAANSAPGVGLGLALSRRLAREMRGNLHLDPTVTDGAAFVLTLPLAT